MKEKIICYDIDGTLTTEMLFIPLIKSEHAKGILDDSSFADIVETLSAYKKGEIAYEDAVQLLIDKHAKGLAEKEISTVAGHAIEFVSNHTHLFRPFASKVINLLKNDYRQFAVTAEPQYLADAVSNYLGLNMAYASVYDTTDGRYTGTIASSLANRAQKAKLLVDYDIFAAFGDSEGDLDMLANSEHPVCIHPSPALRQRANDEKWTIFDGTEDSSEIVKALA